LEELLKVKPRTAHVLYRALRS